MMPPDNEAVVLRIGRRFFCGFGRAGRVTTAWSLAGAKLFLLGDPEIANTQARLANKKRTSECIRVVLDETGLANISEGAARESPPDEADARASARCTDCGTESAQLAKHTCGAVVCETCRAEYHSRKPCPGCVHQAGLALAELFEKSKKKNRGGSKCPKRR